MINTTITEADLPETAKQGRVLIEAAAERSAAKRREALAEEFLIEMIWLTVSLDRKGTMKALYGRGDDALAVVAYVANTVLSPPHWHKPGWSPDEDPKLAESLLYPQDTLEAQVLDPRWSELFDEDVKAKARLAQQALTAPTTRRD